MYGLTATPIRKDGQHPIIYMQCGNIRYRVSNKELKQNKEMEHTVIVKKTNYKYIPEEAKDKILISEIIEDANKQNKSRIILATSTSIGEGFDDSRLDTLFLTMPVSWKGRIIQYVGRLHREHIEKNKVIVYDYLDNMKVLYKMYNRRLKGYKVAGYEIIEE